MTLTECGASARILRELLPGYALHYVDDMRGQAIPFGGRIDALEAIDWICNLFAVPLAEHAAQRWASCIAALGRPKRGRCQSSVVSGPRRSHALTPAPAGLH